jgi:hypothetical protein
MLILDPVYKIINPKQQCFSQIDQLINCNLLVRKGEQELKVVRSIEIPYSMGPKTEINFPSKLTLKNSIKQQRKLVAHSNSKISTKIPLQNVILKKLFAV